MSLEILESLRGQGDALYALLDAGREPAVLTLLYSYEHETRSLYEGKAEAELGPSGPFLVRLDPRSDMLQRLVREGWGRSWGVFLTSSASFDEVRKHFRTLLLVRREKDGSELYFRFYDPRVLRAFLPTCSKKQRGQMFGPVAAYLIESQHGQQLWRMSPADDHDPEVAVDKQVLAASAGTGDA